MLIISTCYPSNTLISVVVELTNKYNFQTSEIVVIDDYSKNKESIKIFNKINLMGCSIIKNTGIKGKGSSLRKGIKHALKSNANYVITADSDGQHLPRDISKIKNTGLKKNEFVLGYRNFDKRVPFRNKFSNKISNWIFYKITNYKINDSQCGLRFIPKRYFNSLIKIKYNKFDYELVTLFKILQENTIEQTRISTIYSQNKYITNFRYFVDTFLILKIFLIYFLRYYLRKYKNT